MTAFWLLLAGHSLGDYAFQTAASIAEKRAKGVRSKRFWQHTMGHGLLTFGALMLAGVDGLGALLGAAFVFATHTAIDWAKVAWEARMGPGLKFRAYLIDQALHVAALLAVSSALQGGEWPQGWEHTAAAWGALVVLSTVGTGHAVDAYLARFKAPDMEEGLHGAGFQIGMLERLLVVAFVVLDVWAGVGFLLAAKSVFRFGDLQRAASRELTEYVLIGTLLSVGGAVLLGLAFRAFAPLFLASAH